MAAHIDIRLRVRTGGEIALGPGKADLLEAIRATGSISAAARSMAMSYSRAWHLVDTMNRCFRAPLVATAMGGARRGGATLTPLGAEALACYRALARAAEAAAERNLAPLVALLAEAPPR